MQKVRAAAIASGQDEEDELNRQKKLEGTAVTTDSFIAWRVRTYVFICFHSPPPSLRARLSPHTTLTV